MNWLTKFMTGTLASGFLLGSMSEPVLAAKFTFEQQGVFTTRFVGLGVPPELPFTPVDGVLTGQFAGEDIDNNQILNLDELTSFSLNFVLEEDYGSLPVDLQYLNNFSYNLSSNYLQFSAFRGSSISFDSINGTSGLIKYGTANGLEFYSNAPLTITEVSEPVAVPEPATVAGFAALVILSIGSRVRRNFTQFQ